jgi:hypothetical protein
MAWILNDKKTAWIWDGPKSPTASELAQKPGTPIVIPPKGSTAAPKTYVWLNDPKTGKLVKTEVSLAKKVFATLPESTQTALSQYLIKTNVTPTTSSLKSLWNNLVDGAVPLYKSGKQASPLDVLKIAIKNTPIIEGVTAVTYKSYDKATANGYLNNVAESIGYDISQLTDAERADFAAKIDAEARKSGKSTTKTTLSGGTETVITPDIFSAKDFAENWLWSKVNFADVTKLPSSAITQLSSVKKILTGYGIDYLSPSEINRLSVELASGKINAQSLMDTYRDIAIKNYPLLAPRLIANPTSTVVDILDPAINLISKWLEIPKGDIGLNNQYLEKYARPDGVAGKLGMPSLYDLELQLKNSPDAEKTSWANESARQGATGLARAMGMPV